jgi:hypothetical protein
LRLKRLSTTAVELTPSPASGLAARAMALLLAALVVGLTIRYNTFADWATDSGAYVGAGLGWARGDVFIPASFVFWAPWAGDGLIECPYGYVPGPVRGTITAQYPLGYPLLIAAAVKMGGPLAAHVVSPILAGLLVWCAFVLGRAASTPWAGAIAALLIAATPVSLLHAIMPFSDVPGAACWALAWVMSLRRGLGAAAAAGAATALAVMIRPNLAPLAIVLGGALVAERQASWGHALKRLVVFGAMAVIGPLIVFWSQAVLYGHPLQSGYKVPLDYFFQAERIPVNAALYPRMLAELHSYWAFAGLLWVPVAVARMRASEDDYMRGVVVLSAVGVIVVNYALYLAYLTYEGWFWLRFMLPAMLALFVLLAGAVDQARLWLNRRWRGAGVVALVPAVAVAWSAREPLTIPFGYDRIQVMEHYLREALPPNAVVLTSTHGGAIAASTGRAVMRLDLVAPGQLESVVADLQRRKLRPVYVLDVAIEGGVFSERFRSSNASRLVWPATAEFVSGSSIVYYDIARRVEFLSGDRWTTDVLLSPPSTQASVAWSDMRPPLERIRLPIPEETSAFRSALEATYRTTLGRAPVPTAVDPTAALTWTRRYLRYRLHGCGHEAAAARVFQQLAGAEPPPLCAEALGVSFPPRNETLDFRRLLDEKLHNQAGGQWMTSVDREGETVWLQEYLRFRAQGCSHDDATGAVLTQIAPAPGRRACVPP